MTSSSENQYKKQITKWRNAGKLPPKHIKGSEYEFMIQKSNQRQAEEQKNTAFLYNGWEVPAEKIDHFKDRYHLQDYCLGSSGIGKPITAWILERGYSKWIYRETFLY